MGKKLSVKMDKNSIIRLCVIAGALGLLSAAFFIGRGTKKSEKVYVNNPALVKENGQLKHDKDSLLYVIDSLGIALQDCQDSKVVKGTLKTETKPGNVSRTNTGSRSGTNSRNSSEGGSTSNQSTKPLEKPETQTCCDNSQQNTNTVNCVNSTVCDKNCSCEKCLAAKAVADTVKTVKSIEDFICYTNKYVRCK